MALIQHLMNETWESTRRTCNLNNADHDSRLTILELAGAIKDMVKVATTADITLSGAQTIDGVSIVAGDRVLVKDQSTGSQNGIYVASASAWARATDADSASDFTKGCTVKAEKGTANADKYFTLTTDAPITLGSTSLIFAQFDAYGATEANTANKIVKRDSSGNFSAGTITANLTGNCSGSSGSCTGNAATATAATTAAAISATGAYTDPLKIGTGATTIWLWANAAGKLLIKVSATAPTTDSDGTVVGDQSAS